MQEVEKSTADVIAALLAENDALRAALAAGKCAWNFDMSAAPRGKMSKIKRMIGKAEAEVEVFTPDIIIAAGRCSVVTVSRWLPNAQRWNMFSQDAPPIAWQPFPSHPRGRE